MDYFLNHHFFQYNALTSYLSLAQLFAKSKLGILPYKHTFGFFVKDCVSLWKSILVLHMDKYKWKLKRKQ